MTDYATTPSASATPSAVYRAAEFLVGYELPVVVAGASSTGLIMMPQMAADSGGELLPRVRELEEAGALLRIEIDGLYEQLIDMGQRLQTTAPGSERSSLETSIQEALGRLARLERREVKRIREFRQSQRAFSPKQAKRLLREAHALLTEE